MRTYEELTGETGRRMYYRATRYRPAELFGPVAPDVRIADDVAVLKNISMTGIAANSRSADRWEGMEGSEIPVELALRGEQLFEGRGRICRVEANGVRATVALHVTSGAVDLSHIVSNHEGALLKQALADPAFGTSHGILPAYKELCAEILDLFRSYKALLEDYENGLRATGPERERLLSEALFACEERMVPQWKELWYRGNDIVAPIMDDPERLRLHKRYTERVLTPDFMPGPVMRRCYEKPFGYPGDFKIMNYVYRWEREGGTPYEKLLHRIGIETGACVGTRLRMTQRLLAETIAETAGETPMRIANLGCGSAYEVFEYLGVERVPRPLDFTLIDQDHRALDCAYELSYPLVARHAGRVRVQCLQASFAELLRAGTLFQSLPPQDFIYSLGLFDYLSAKRAAALTHDLYEQLAPGGKLVIANVKQGRETCMWPLEFVTDWSLVYRSKSDMEAMAGGLDIASCSIVEDPTKCVYVMVLDKPGPAVSAAVRRSAAATPAD